MDECVARFNARQDAVPDAAEAWRQLSVAIGYAMYDPTKDSCVENVFSRADKMMYRQERKMKALR